MQLSSVDKSLELIETKILDPAGYFPVASSVSGALRSVLGVALIVIGLSAAIFSALKYVFTSTDSEENKAIADMDQGVRYFSHGVANIYRGIVEMLPYINMITIPYDGGTVRDYFKSSITNYQPLKPVRLSYLEKVPQAPQNIEKILFG